MNMLKHRTISAEIGKETITIKSNRGFPQGGCLSPLLWCLLLDSLVKKINEMKIYMQAYSDDGVLLVAGKDLNTVMTIMKTGIKTTLTWCRDKGLNLNPTKNETSTFYQTKENNTPDTNCN
ncbi:jg24658 [Pararge aegeria aegeria]|uniref:Jg24658 protein n=1 Tax=Pararge aegeria aegeria TaxID=348720 RepID=A0A8S4QRK4_9NEOP|nr:jg24658 [Pararge aegeria aegeria]